MDEQKFNSLYAPVLRELESDSAVADAFIDRDRYRLHVALLWAQIVLGPARFGLTEDELEPLHDRLNSAIAGVLGPDASITACFEFVISPAGQASLGREHADTRTRNTLHYVASLILNPEGHREWLEDQRRDG